MSRIFILAFVLFVTLFAVNSAPLALEKRETKFGPCPGLPTIDVKITPDPAVAGGDETFDIKGTIQKDIVTGDWIILAFLDVVAKQLLEEPLDVDICSLPGVTCPIKVGTEFSITQNYIAPPKFPNTYVILVGIGRGIPPNTEPLGCAVALVGGSKLSAVSSADLEVWNYL
jgi:hypothetical protein